MIHVAVVMAFLPYNTVIVAAGVAAVGCAAGVIGTFGVLRKRALVGDAAAHATLVGVALALLVTGQRNLAVLLIGGLISAMVAIILLVLIRKFTRTRDDAATAIVLSVSFGLGITLISGMVSRGIPGSGGLERFLLGHTASLTANDALLLGTVSVVSVLCIVVGLKEATMVAFDPDFAAAAGWPAAILRSCADCSYCRDGCCWTTSSWSRLGNSACSYSPSRCSAMDRTAYSHACYRWDGRVPECSVRSCD